MENKTNASALLAEFPIPTYQQWADLVEKQLKGVPLEKKLVRQTVDGLTIHPIYFRSDLDESSRSSLPGFFPYTRHTGKTGLIKKGWQLSQSYADPDISSLNEAMALDVRKGLSTLMIALDQAGKSGLDPDRVDRDKIGKGGTSIYTAEDLRSTFKRIDLENIGLLIDAGASTFSFLCLLMSDLNSHSFPLSRLNGASVFDPYSTAAVLGSLPRSMDRYFNEMVGLARWTQRNTPCFRPIGIDARPYSEAGGSVTQELTYALATAVEYIREMLRRGVTIEQAAGSMSFFLGIGSDFFTEIAKLRVARTLWAKIVSAFGGSEEARKSVIHSVSLNWNKTVHDPYVNILRATTEAYSSILGGCDSLSIAPFDQVLGLPQEFSRRISRNIQMILKEECHGHRVIDPAGGSWYVEKLTQDLAENVWKNFQDIEKEGGFLSILEKNTVRDHLEQTAKKQEERVAQRQRVIVGTNMYPNLEESLPKSRAFDQPAFAKERSQQAESFKSNRTEITGLDMPRDSEVKSVEAVDKFINLVGLGLTLGEINIQLSGTGEPLEVSSPLNQHRLAAEYEDLRKKAKAHQTKNGRYPQVFLANMGPLRQHKARADFCVGFLEPGGFSPIYSDGFDTAEDAAKAALTSKARIVVICSTDESYPEIVPRLTKSIKDQDPKICVMVAGYPKDHIDGFHAAGVDDFIHLKANHLQCLKNLQQKLGVEP